jgi:hypothetical protein
MSWKQTIVTLAAATSTLLVAANPNRTGLRWMNVGANPFTVAPGLAAAVANVGDNYAAGAKEDFLPREDSQDAFTAISTAGTSVAVWEEIPALGIVPPGSGI